MSTMPRPGVHDRQKHKLQGLGECQFQFRELEV